MGRVTRGRRSKGAERFVNQFRAGLAIGATLLVLVLGYGPSFAPSLFGSEEDSLSTDRRQLVSVAEDDSFFAGMRNRRRLAGDCSDVNPGMGAFDNNGGVVFPPSFCAVPPLARTPRFKARPLYLSAMSNRGDGIAVLPSFAPTSATTPPPPPQQ